MVFPTWHMAGNTIYMKNDFYDMSSADGVVVNVNMCERLGVVVKDVSKGCVGFMSHDDKE